MHVNYLNFAKRHGLRKPVSILCSWRLPWEAVWIDRIERFDQVYAGQDYCNFVLGDDELWSHDVGSKVVWFVWKTAYKQSYLAHFSINKLIQIITISVRV
jgi:hypothetical protein